MIRVLAVWLVAVAAVIAAALPRAEGGRITLLGAGKPVAGGAAFVPSDLTNLYFWHDFSDGATVTTGTGGITQITDKSGNSRTASQGTSGVRPDYVTAGSGINSLGAAQFIAANADVMTIASALSSFQNKTGFSFVAVLRPTSFADVQNNIFNGFMSTGLFAMYSFYFANTGELASITRRVNADTAFGTPSVTTLTLNQAAFVAVVVDYSGRDISLYINSATESTLSPTPGWVGGSSQNNAAVDDPRYGTVGANETAMDLGEAAGYDRALTSGEIGQLLAYAQAKWATP